MSRVLVKRVRRKMMGGRFEMRIYDDGASRVSVDHPSNDPEIEMAMIGRVIATARRHFAEAGIEVNFGPVTWRDDP